MTAITIAQHPKQNPEKNREHLARQITELAAHIHAATYQLLVLIREFDAASGWEGFGMLSCAHWLNWRCGISLGAAREKVRIAHALPATPQAQDSGPCIFLQNRQVACRLS